MTEFVSSPAEQSAEIVEPTPDVRARSRLSLKLVGTLVVALLLAGGAIWLAAGAREDRDEARRARTEATLELQRAREHLATARGRESTRRAAVTTASGLFTEYATATGAIVALLDEETQLAVQVQGEGARPDASVDDFNATMDRHNDLVDRYNAALYAFSRHFSDTEPEIT